MPYYIVYELQLEHFLQPGGYVGTPPPDKYEDRYNPVCIDFTFADAAAEACVKAAQKTRRLGKYVAVEAHPMELDFSAHATGLPELEKPKSEKEELDEAKEEYMDGKIDINQFEKKIEKIGKPKRSRTRRSA